MLCPVRALDAYVHEAALWHKNEQLFICFGPSDKGSPASKQRMIKWVIEAISLAYESTGQPSPMAVRSHSTRNMAASKALISGVALQEVCDAEGWSFTRHIHQIVFLGPGLYPRFSSALVLVLLIIFHTGQALVAIFPKRQNWQQNSLERERSVSAVTSVPWRGNKRCVPGQISFVPIGNLLRLLASDSFVWAGFIAS